ncbi:trehalose-6-phosphate synthase [Methylovirgula sp. HY1]|uniref:alpha,alpha-trehalose-phosphate synthase (UDP-forming) n=1 Tax=Methylovirgula sp. HY1 TaxID=2822761 RepID=UPI001C5B6E53|nr:trehalose-6-phosphate synthase [Methylovirgula sp. HY1]QXX75609.1 Trehalose-6-phosphate synthase [Methylovirgula sp. HY1]
MARIVIVSNRVPSSAARGPQAGGLAVALKDCLKDGGLWFGWSGETAPQTCADVKIGSVGKIDFATIDLSREDYRQFYVGFANSALWPLLHFQPGLVEFDRAHFETYLSVNRIYARALAALIEPTDLIWVHDYHLIPLAYFLRALGVENRVGFFLHVPFVPASLLSVLPRAEKLLRMLCAFDVVGFQTHEHLRDFEDCVRNMLNVTTDVAGPIIVDNHPVLAIATPIGIDARSFARQAKRSAHSRVAKRLDESMQGRALIIGVDRLDYSKGLPNRFDAFGRLLDRFSEHRLKVSYLQVAARSREDVAEYQRLKRDLDRRAGEVNGRHAEFDWVPLRYITRAISRATLAGFYRKARVGLVTPLRDGMNLVAKEYVAAQDPDDPGVLVLSRFAGAAEDLTEALIVNPLDADEIAEAMHQALTMPRAERKARHEKLFEKICQTTATTYCRDFLSALLGGPYDVLT